MANTARQIKIYDDSHREIFLELCEELKKWNLEYVGEEAEISPSTLYLWVNGSTYCGKLPNIVKVAKVIGMKLRWDKGKPKKSKPKLRVVK